ncbi:MAG: VWA domain-containing protein [Myxococcales bacterium]|nr:VWA domain-containing protein [Myxococcales bacterium]
MPTKRGSSVVMVADASKNGAQSLRYAFTTLRGLVDQQNLSGWSLTTTPSATTANCGIQQTVGFGSNAARWKEVMDDESKWTGQGNASLRAAIDSATTRLMAQSGMGRDKFIILMTSGGGLGHCSPDDYHPEESITAALTQGIRTYLLGTSRIVNEREKLNEMALAGGVARDDEIKFYESFNDEDIRNILMSLSQQLASCRLDLGEAPPVADNVLVKVGQTKLEFGSENGWVYDGNDVVLVQGNACTKLIEGEAQVSVLFGCPGIPVL